MRKKTSWLLIVTSLATLLPMLFGVALWDRLPEQIATHFGADGQPNGWESRGFTVYGIPLVLLGVHLLAAAFLLADPKRKNIEGKPQLIVLWLIPACSVMLLLSIYSSALGWPISEMLLMFLFLAIFLLVLGNYMPKCKQNYTIGYRFGWTLEDPDNWYHTHRFAGWAMTLGGVILLATAWWHPVWLAGVVLAVSLLSPILYSFLYMMKKRKAE